MSESKHLHAQPLVRMREKRGVWCAPAVLRHRCRGTLVVFSPTKFCKILRARHCFGSYCVVSRKLNRDTYSSAQTRMKRAIMKKPRGNLRREALLSCIPNLNYTTDFRVITRCGWKRRPRYTSQSPVWSIAAGTSVWRPRCTTSSAGNSPADNWPA